MIHYRVSTAELFHILLNNLSLFYHAMMKVKEPILSNPIEVTKDSFVFFSSSFLRALLQMHPHHSGCPVLPYFRWIRAHFLGQKKRFVYCERTGIAFAYDETAALELAWEHWIDDLAYLAGVQILQEVVLHDSILNQLLDPIVSEETNNEFLIGRGFFYFVERSWSIWTNKLSIRLVFKS